MQKTIKMSLFTIGLICLLLMVTPATSIVHAAVNCSDPGVVCKSGAINSNETWTSDNIYVITADLTISSGVTVTINPGVIVKFTPYSTSLLVDGTLNVNGTAIDKVYFTSDRDDTLGGDTDGTGATYPPAAGQWKAISFRNGSDGTWTHTEIRYGGSGGGAIALSGSSPSFDNLTVKNSAVAAISALPTDMPTITNFSVQDTPRGGLNFHGGTITGNITWSQSDIAHVISADVTINDGATLNIGPGVIVKFVPYSNSLLVDGTLNVNGTATEKVYFTSNRDDTLGGDTDGTGATYPPGTGQWKAINFRNGSDGTWTHSEIRYGGSGGGAIALSGSSPSFDNLTVKNSAVAAISALPTDMPTITNFSVQDTPRGGLNFHGGTITGNITWSQSDIAHIISADVTINNGATLNIGPGVIIKFVPYSNSLLVDGTLNVNGTATEKVYFTSNRDDTLGGDTDGTDATYPPGTGQWKAISFRNGSDGTWTHSEIRYGGSGGGAIALSGSSPSFDNLTVKNSAVAAISALPTDMPTITNFSVQDTPRGGLNFHGGTITGNITWSQSDIAHVISADVTINDGATLNISPGVIVKFVPYSNSLLVDGTLNVNGTASDKVYFTSNRDDTLGGDTDGTDATYPPGTGQWRSIKFRPGSIGTIDHAEVRYGGTTSTLGAIHADNTNPTITNSVLRFNNIGLFSSGAGAAPTIHNTQIYDNNRYGVYNDTSGNWIDATGNWWGDDGGPNDSSNADGKVNDNSNGDKVSDYVTYTNWQLTPGVAPVNYFIFLPMVIK